MIALNNVLAHSRLYFSVTQVFKPPSQQNTITKTSLLELNQSLQKTNDGQNNLSYLTPATWNNLPDFLKISENLNKYKVKS